MAGIIPPEIVEQVRHASDIVDVIGGYVPLKKAGAKFKALSPFNKEKTPSFYVDPAQANVQVLQQRPRRRRLQVSHADGEHDLSRGGPAAGPARGHRHPGRRRPHDPAGPQPARGTARAQCRRRGLVAEAAQDRSRRGTGPRLSQEPRFSRVARGGIRPRLRARRLGRHAEVGAKSGLQHGGARDGQARRHVGIAARPTTSFAGG